MRAGAAPASSGSGALPHYDVHLGEIYTWMLGGLESARVRAEGEIAELDLRPRLGGLAVDLGAGPGAHARALARRGFDVVAIDACRLLVNELSNVAESTSIKPVHGRFEAFERHLDRRPELIVCLGDTLTHLDDETSVDALLDRIARALEPGGRFVASFRDYSTPLEGTERFVPVRSDPQRILTCFLEYSDTRVTVHDLLHERRGAEWKLKVGRYRKLRIAPDSFESRLLGHGFAVDRKRGADGLVWFSATKGGFHASPMADWTPGSAR